MINEYEYSTIHGLSRVQQRTGLTESKSAKLINKARKYGQLSNTLPKHEREYMERENNKQEDCNAVYYENMCFIFSNDGICVTAFNVPRWFLKKKYFDGKTRIKKPNKYYCYV